MHHFIVIDYQNDFCTKGGKWFKERPCQTFIEKTLIPFFRINKLKFSEIISDYRLPRPNETIDYCVPETWGYQSAIPSDIKKQNVWIKAMNSPEWVRENIGDPNGIPGLPYPDSIAFSQWLEKTIGKPNQDDQIVLIGLTLDCCVLCTAQQLYFRGYNVKILKEATDVYDVETAKTYIKDGDDYKDFLFQTTHGMWSKAISWDDLSLELQATLPAKDVCSFRAKL